MFLPLRGSARRCVSGLLALAMMLCQTPLFAHDVWIEPTTFSPKPGQTVGLRLRVGEHFQGEPMPLVPELVNQFMVEDTVARRPLRGRPRGEEAGALRVVVPGMQIIGYRSNRSAIELDADKFNAYLKDEGLDAIMDLRALQNASGAAGREVYSRCAKSLVFSGLPDTAQGDRFLGFPLELVAERNPYAIAVGEILPVRLLYQSRPLAGALVVAINRENPTDQRAARTDVEGRVGMEMHRRGAWLIKAVHMVPAPLDANAEWESFWASLTFEVRSTTIVEHRVAKNPG